MNRYRVKPGEHIKLKEWDANQTHDCDGGKAEGRQRLADLGTELAHLQELLYAEHKHKLLIILQAMDTGGKDGTIRDVFHGVNPQGVKVASFKGPTPFELDRDYLWRVHLKVPAKGEMTIFNRSHYEDVLIARVHKLVPKEVWSRRFEHINAFEQMLADEGTVIRKFYLHIDLEEQKARIQSRLDDSRKNWKFNAADLEERKLWSDYMKAYEDVLEKTSTEWAPWYVVPANRKWYRNLVVAEVLVKTLKNLDMAFPKPAFDPLAYRVD
ncbi:MAG: polyphosphate kinase 2 family protein [Phycisphaerae bacterium]|nr:polyphosphate kinase 2 family protein [Phycisphaerae bacterium]